MSLLKIICVHVTFEHYFFIINTLLSKNAGNPYNRVFETKLLETIRLCIYTLKNQTTRRLFKTMRPNGEKSSLHMSNKPVYYIYTMTYCLCNPGVNFFGVIFAKSSLSKSFRCLIILCNNNKQIQYVYTTNI